MYKRKYKDKKKLKEAVQEVKDKIKARVINIVLETKELLCQNKTLQDKIIQLEKEKDIIEEEKIKIIN